MRRIQQELMKHGATLEQANYYVRRVKECERLSRSEGHSHHILPRNCGWWKRHDTAQWNRAKVTLELHISLHADLCQIFPDNQSLKRALKITVSLLRPSIRAHIKKSKKKDIIRWYANGSSAKEIALRLKVNGSTITRWLREWNITVRGPGEMGGLVITWEAKKRKEEILSWYREGRSSLFISKKIGVNYQTILNWLRSWGIKPRLRGWRGNGGTTRKRRCATKKLKRSSAAHSQT